ncbi:hypothetical protein HDV05_005720 [Chytridiales sp. JEL 0842]|nr:hypothetical protein HDV05_005720 [Chytridiales sp. JEL 0842]
MSKPGRSVNISKTTSALLGGGSSSTAGSHLLDAGPDLNFYTPRSSSSFENKGEISDTDIASTLAARLGRGKVYTAVGNRVVVALNPGRPVADFCKESGSRSARFKGQEQGEGYEIVDVDDIQPVMGDGGEDVNEAKASSFQLVESAFLHMMQQKKDQSILLTGESGSGKTFTFDLVTHHLLNIVRSSDTISSLETRVSNVQTVLKAFTQAFHDPNLTQTCMSTYLEYQFDANGQLVGLKTLVTPLSSTRIGTGFGDQHLHQDGRSFDVFYYMLEGLTSEEKRSLFLTSDASSFKYLSHFRTRTFRRKDASGFQLLQTAFSKLGFKPKIQSSTWKILAALLHLGNIQFSHPTDQEACTTKDTESLEAVQSLLGIPPSAIIQCLTYRTVQTQNSRYSVILTAAEAHARRDCLARWLYNTLIQLIVDKINRRVAQDEAHWSNYISVWDLPGEPPLDANNNSKNKNPSSLSLDTLGVFYGNAKVGALVMQQVYQKPHDLLTREGVEDLHSLLPVPRSKFAEGLEAVLDILHAESIAGLQKGRGDRDFDAVLVEKLKGAGLVEDSGLKVSTAGGHGFVIRQSETSVIHFDATGWVGANHAGNTAVEDLKKLLSDVDSKLDRLLRVLLQLREIKQTLHRTCSESTSLPPPTSTQTPDNPIMDLCIGSEFPTTASNLRTNLSDLLDAVSDTFIWWIPHVRISHDSKSFSHFDPVVVLNQVRKLNLACFANSLGGLYTTTMTTKEFLERYKSILTSTTTAVSTTEDSDADVLHPGFLCDSIAKEMELVTGLEYHRGLNYVFLSEASWRLLESKLGDLFANRQAALWAEQQQQANQEHRARFDLDFEDEDGLTEMSLDLSDGRRKGLEVVVTGAEGEGKGSKRMKADQGRVIKPKSRTRQNWLCLTWCLTWWIPSYFLRVCGQMKRSDVQLAWREKLALCMLIILLCGLVLFFIIGIGLIMCPKQYVMSQGQIDGLNTTAKPYVSIYGSYYHIPDIVKSHVRDKEYLNTLAMEQTTLGHDVSAMFYKTIVWKNYCNLPQPSGWDNIVRAVPKQAFRVWFPHQGKTEKGQQIDYIRLIAPMRKGFIARDPKWIEGYLAADPENNKLIIAYDRVYDMSTYLSPMNTNNFMGPNIRKIVNEFGTSGKDVTQYLEAIRKAEGQQAWENYMGCLNGLFFTGVVDRRNDPKCVFSNYILLAASIVICSVIGMKFLAALQCSFRRSPEDHKRYIICQVPCYTEGPDSLLRTFESLLLSGYDDSRKLIFVISDGLIVGSGNDKPTPDIVLDVLGHPTNQRVDSHMFLSLGEGQRQLNMAKVYSGHYSIHGKSVPYIVVVKVGTPKETSKPGNRGKRDTQLLIMRYLNKVHFDKEMNPLELEITRQMKHMLNLDPKLFEFVLWVDADTEVVGICGETVIANEMESWVTMIQVYEYFISHHLSKAFESVFGSVTCLPGCFCMYRIKSASGNPLLISPGVIKDFSENTVDTLHLKNLLHLGEDRYLTTLMMKHFPSFKLTFTADAKCKTNAPDQWEVLVSQRRRWINSTVHTLLELMTIKNLCGFCLFSMRAIVLLDLVSTCVQPSAIIYIGYLIYSIIVDSQDGTHLIALIMIGVIYGGQMVIFLAKGEFQHMGWLVIYILAMPIYSFYLPLYAFWHFDDFSWGNTRVVVDDLGSRHYDRDEEEFDESVIPLKTWTEYETELHLVHRATSSPQQHLGVENWLYQTQMSIPAYTATSNSLYYAASSAYGSEADHAQHHRGSPPSDFGGVTRESIERDLIEIEVRRILSVSDLGKVNRRSVRAQVMQALQGRISNIQGKKKLIDQVLQELLTSS